MPEPSGERDDERRGGADRSREHAPHALVLVTGGVACGKSTVSRALAERLSAERLEADRIRNTLLAALDDDPHGAESRWRRDLSPGFEADVYADLLRRAAALLAAGRTVVLDACFPRSAQRRAARALAARTGARFLVVACRIDEETLRARLAARDRVSTSGGWTAIATRLERDTEPLEIAERPASLVVESDGPVEPIVEAILDRLATRPPATAPVGPLIEPVPEAVSFDCWSTLLAEEDWPWAHALRVRALRDAAHEAGLQVSDEIAAAAFDAAWRQHMTLWLDGRASGAPEVAQWGLAELGLRDPHPPALEHLVRRFEEASHTSRVTALEGAVDVLEALNAQGTACVLVCDTGLTPGRVVRRLLDGAGLLEHLRVLAFSDEVGVPKPDTRAFQAALAPLGVPPERCAHVGDLRRTDVAGARALGMRTVRIKARHDDRSDGPDADYVVASHAELGALLGLWPHIEPAPVPVEDIA